MLIACHWRAGKEDQFRRAARLGDGFISISDTPEEYAKVAEKVRIYAGEEGKDFDRMESAFYMTVNLGDDPKAAAEEAEKYLADVLRGQYLGQPLGSLRPNRDDHRAYPSVRAGRSRHHNRGASPPSTRRDSWTPS